MLLLQIPEFSLVEFLRAVKAMNDAGVSAQLRPGETTVHKDHTSEGSQLAFVVHQFYLTVRGIDDEALKDDPRTKNVVALSRLKPNPVRYLEDADVFEFHRMCMAVAVYLYHPTVQLTSEELPGKVIETLQRANIYRQNIEGAPEAVLRTAIAMTEVIPKLLFAEDRTTPYVQRLFKASQRGVVGQTHVQDMIIYVQEIAQRL